MTPSGDNLIVNGDFETGDYVPWFITLPSNNGGPSVVDSDSTPGFASHPTGGDYALKLDLDTFTSTFAEVDFGYRLTNTIAGRNYAISFDMVGCGLSADGWAVLVGSKTIYSAVSQGDCTGTWTKYTGTFVGTGNDLIKISVVTSTAFGFSQWYFDNFVVVEA